MRAHYPLLAIMFVAALGAIAAHAASVPLRHTVVFEATGKTTSWDASGSVIGSSTIARSELDYYFAADGKIFFYMGSLGKDFGYVLDPATGKVDGAMKGRFTLSGDQLTMTVSGDRGDGGRGEGHNVVNFKTCELTLVYDGSSGGVRTRDELHTTRCRVVAGKH